MAHKPYTTPQSSTRYISAHGQVVPFALVQIFPRRKFLVFIVASSSKEIYVVTAKNYWQRTRFSF